MKKDDPNKTNSSILAKNQIINNHLKLKTNQSDMNDQTKSRIEYRTSVDRSLQNKNEFKSESPYKFDNGSCEQFRMMSENELNHFYSEYGNINSPFLRDSHCNKNLDMDKSKASYLEIPDKLKDIIENYNEDMKSDNSSFNSSGKNFLEEGKKIIKNSKFTNKTDSNNTTNNRKTNVTSFSPFPSSIHQSHDNSSNRYKQSKKDINNSKIKISHFNQDDKYTGFTSSKISLKSLTDSQSKKDPDSLTQIKTSINRSKNRQRDSFKDTIIIGSKQSLNNTLHTSNNNTVKNSTNSESFINPEKISLKSTENDFYRQESFVNLQNNDSDFFQTQNDQYHQSGDDSDGNKTFGEKR